MTMTIPKRDPIVLRTNREFTYTPNGPLIPAHPGWYAIFNINEERWAFPVAAWQQMRVDDEDTEVHGLIAQSMWITAAIRFENFVGYATKDQIPSGVLSISNTLIQVRIADGHEELI